MGRFGRMLGIVCLLAGLATGCAPPVTVRQAESADLFGAWRASAVEADELSPRSLQTIRRWAMEETYRQQPQQAFMGLQAVAEQQADPELLFTLAELTCLLGRRAEKTDGHVACAFYYLCAGYAYHFLFPADPAAADTLVFDPRFRLACDLYNAGLTKCLRMAQQAGRLDPGHELHMPTRDGDGFKLSVAHHGFPWKPEEFGPFRFAEDYQVVGLTNLYRGYGLGVPLIGTGTPQQRVESAHFPPEVGFPITAFFHFEGGLADLRTSRAGRLELFNPFTTQTATVNGRSVPLQTDLTTPLAYFLSRSDLHWAGYQGFLHVEQALQRAGIYMLEPYQPGKIPVLMVHGLLSSPLTWTTMFNDLMADSEMRQHFQFWFYLYPTGDTYLAASANLRDELAQLRHDLDPDGRDAALDRLVCIGHSMGGLVSKLLTVDSGDRFWGLVGKEPFDRLKARPETRAELERIYFFERRPEVARVVFLGTPHHGSSLSPSLPARLANRFVELPGKLMTAARDLAKENPGLFPGDLWERLPTSLDFLAPAAPALEVLAALPPPPGVHYHSIIGDSTGKGPQGSDGVVPVASAHLETAKSELLVPADHTHVHHHPRAVQEVRRILLEHLEDIPLAISRNARE
jgi:pimeloyl-ACP methyl ester carboxylesterase